MNENRTTFVGRLFIRGSLLCTIPRLFGPLSSDPVCGCWLLRRPTCQDADGLDIKYRCSAIFTCCKSHFECSWLGSEVPRLVQSAASPLTHPKIADRNVYTSLRGGMLHRKVFSNQTDNELGTRRFSHPHPHDAYVPGPVPPQRNGTESYPSSTWVASSPWDDPPSQTICFPLLDFPWLYPSVPSFLSLSSLERRHCRDEADVRVRFRDANPDGHRNRN